MSSASDIANRSCGRDGWKESYLEEPFLYERNYLQAEYKQFFN
jgi:hypothetical protein